MDAFRDHVVGQYQVADYGDIVVQPPSRGIRS
jgi:hypothetical protein